MDFGTRLRAYREKAGLSQNALGRASGLNPATINRFESGQRSPDTRSSVEQICAALELSAPECDDLLAAAGYLPDIYSVVPPSDPTLLAVAQALGDTALPDADREELRSIVTAICRRWRASGPGGST